MQRQLSSKYQKFLIKAPEGAAEEHLEHLNFRSRAGFAARRPATLTSASVSAPMCHLFVSRLSAARRAAHTVQEADGVTAGWVHGTSLAARHPLPMLPRLPAADAAPQLNFLAQQLEWALAQTTQLHHDMAALNVLLVRLNGKN